MSIMLAIETSQRVGSVALRDAVGVVQVEPLREARRHDDDLLPAIDRLVRRCQLTPSDLDSVAVSIGPGGFTGLRIAVSTAKMFAQALSVQLLAVPSALVAAESTDVPADAALVALASKGETFWASMLERAGSAAPWQIVGEPSLADATDAAFERVQVVLADEHFPDDARQRCMQRGISIVPPAFTAAACLVIGERMAAAGQFVDPLRLGPLYPRRPEAVRVWEKRKLG